MIERAVRIKAIDDPVAQRCLAAVGGHIALPIGKPPMFHFSTQFVYDEYCKLLREAKAKKAN